MKQWKWGFEEFDAKSQVERAIARHMTEELDANKLGVARRNDGEAGEDYVVFCEVRLVRRVAAPKFPEG